MTNCLEYFFSRSLAINGAIVLVVAIGLTLALRHRLPTVPRRLLFLLATLSLGGILQVALLRDPPNAACRDCLTKWPVDRLISGELGMNAALNIALFVPFGLFASLLWKAPFRVTGAAALLSLIIEIIQPLLGV